MFSEIDAYYSVINLETGEYCNNKSEQVFLMQGDELEVYRSLTGADIRDPYPGLYSGSTAFGYYENLLTVYRACFRKHMKVRKCQRSFPCPSITGRDGGIL